MESLRVSIYLHTSKLRDQADMFPRVELEEAYAAQQYNSTEDSNSSNHTSQSLEADTEAATKGVQSGTSIHEKGSAEEPIKSAV